MDYSAIFTIIVTKYVGRSNLLPVFDIQYRVEHTLWPVFYNDEDIFKQKPANTIPIYIIVL